tara:strand:- start:577 stop:1089 length:513 start_codon:yes stop_codon:yes gene_type:complete
MRIKLGIILLFFIVKSPVAFGQMDDLSVLGILGESLSQPTESQSDSEPPVSNQEELQSQIDINQRDFKDYDYGYTGGQSFNNPPLSKFSNEPLEYFGYSYFSKNISNNYSSMNIPVPPDYLIGPNDNVKIILFGNSNKRYELTVTRDGDIFIPEIGPLYVAGITFQDMKD